MSISQNLENFYSSIWNCLPQPSFVITSDLKIVEVNSASEVYCATSKSRILNKKITDFINESSLLIKVVRETVKEQRPTAVNTIDVYWVGKSVDTSNVYCAPLEGYINSVLLIINPTTNADRINRNLLHRNAARSVSGLAAMLGHEIRNPLAGISGAAQLLAQNANREDLKLTDLIRSESNRIGNLVSKFEIFGDVAPLARNSVNIHDVLEKSKDLAKAGFASHIRIFEDYDPSLPNIRGHFDQLTQVFLNLLKNAAEAVPAKGGTVKICTSYRSGIKVLSMNSKVENLPISIEIVDNGRGISADIVDTIFDPFISTKKAGSGLGLALVSKIIADHGGTVECRSIEGRTTFNIYMPLGEVKDDGLSDFKIHSRLLSKDSKI